jgi:hypothetical protein
MRTRQRSDDDERHGVLRDGEVRRVPLYLRDGSDWRGDMHRHFHGDGRFGFAEVNDRRRSRTVKRDPRGRVISQSESEEIEEDDAMQDSAPRRPGFTRDALNRIEAAYQEVEQRDSVAWMGDRWGGKVGAECTINGAPGHLKMVRGELQCVPDDDAQDAMPLTGDAALDADLIAAQNIDDPVERAYAETEARDRHAWKRT